jgi:crotonobetainyl-CoA:carnitine CoA-transferase CaiB-like acyl-CoA transferase
VADDRKTSLLPPTTKVVELGESFSTALAGRFLQRMGAQVTTVLPAGEEQELDTLGPHLGGSDSLSAVAVWLRDRKTLRVLDTRSAGGAAQLDSLLAEADVVLVAGRTYRWRERGVELETLRGRAPKAVIGHVTPWGDSGPYADRRPNELLLQAAGGLLKLVGSPTREPVRLGGHPMQAASGLLILDGVLIGLFRRQSTGQPASFSMSDFESVAHLEWKIASVHQSGKPIDKRGDEGGGPLVAKTPDGHFGLLFIPSDWNAVKDLIDDPRLDDEKFATPGARAAHEAELKAIVEETTRRVPKKDLYAGAQARRIPSGYVATISDLLASPQYRARHFFQEVEVGEMRSGEIPDAPWQVWTIDDLQDGEFA